jgi:hypothetical protein
MTDLVTLIETATDEELDKIIAQLQLVEDYEAYASNILKVQTLEGKISPLSLNGPQRILHDIIENYIAPKRLVRVVALKARRMGFSTYFSGRFYRETSCRQNRYALQITHEPQATDFLFKMVKRFYNLSPSHLKPETLYNNTRLLEFNNKQGTGLNSAFRVATAGKEDVGSGQLIHYLHLSETSKWAAHNTSSLLTSVMQCVPDEPGTEIVFESTAKGIGGEFYDRFWNAKYRIWVARMEDGKPVIEETINEKANEDDIYTSIFLPWFCFEKYQMSVPLGWQRVAEEEELVTRFGVTDRQLAWRRWIIANKCKGQDHAESISIFNQEYPSDPRSAFLGTGRPVFNALKIAARMDAAPAPKARYEYHANNWVATDKGRLRVWEEPKNGEDYIIAADVAEGIAGGDYSCADVINHRTGQHVAQWHGSVDSDNIMEFADILSGLGKRYNLALIACERNNHGLGVVTQLFHYGYPKLYMEMVPDPPGKPRKRYGWVTSRTTRPLIIDNLIKEVTEGSDGIVCKETFEEMLSFKIQDNGKMEADSGCHDDRVMSYAIAKYVRQVTDLPSMYRPDRNRDRQFGRNSKKISAKAWT